MAEKEGYLGVVRELLHSQPLAVLATLLADQGERPYTNLIAFAATSDLKELVFATLRTSRKFANLTAHPRVSLLIDNRANQETDFVAAAAVTVFGHATEVPPPAREAYRRFFLEKHPILREFVSRPDCALIRVQVEKFIVVTRFQDVQEVSPP